MSMYFEGDRFQLGNLEITKVFTEIRESDGITYINNVDIKKTRDSLVFLVNIKDVNIEHL